MLRKMMFQKFWKKKKQSWAKRTAHWKNLPDILQSPLLEGGVNTPLIAAVRVPIPYKKV